MAAEARKQVTVRITGRVQGVWFRGWTMEQAVELNLKGWVRNRRDGSVEAFFSGEATNVDRMIRLCWEGPGPARVDDVEVQDHQDSSPFTGFHQLPTC